MKKKITLFIGLLTSFNMIAQNSSNDAHNRCGSDVAKQIQLSTPGFIEEHEKLELFTEHFNLNASKGGSEKTATITIPIVFHVNKSSNPTQVTTQQIQSAIDILNEDFNGLNAGFATVRAEFQGIKANVGVQFCLATKDPQGNVSTGITYHTNNYDGREPDNTGSTIKLLSGWPCNKYLNVWLTSDPAGNGDTYESGWAFYPSSTYVSQGIDGIVYNDRYLGKYGTGASAYNDPYNSHMCHVLTHEVGHWLNLEHTFENYCSAPGDQVDDTPPVYYYGSTNCEQIGEKCSGVTMVNDENFMDYTYCYAMFTEGQKTRMLATLNSSVGSRNNLWSDANLLAAGCSNTGSNGLENLSLIESVQISPNPNTGNFEIVINSLKETNFKIEIQDMMGRVVEQKEYQNVVGSISCDMSILHASNGIYNCIITSKNGDKLVRKIVKE